MSPRTLSKPALKARENALPREESSGFRKLSGWALIVGSLLVALAFASPAEKLAPGALAMPNPLGPIGELLRFLFVRPFGVGAFLLTFLLLHRGTELLALAPANRWVARMVGAFVGMFGLGALAMAFAPTKTFPGGVVPLGGILGEWIHHQVAKDLGPSLFTLSAALLSFAGVILATEDLIANLVRGRRPAGVEDPAKNGRSAQRKPKARGIAEEPANEPEKAQNQETETEALAARRNNPLEVAPRRSRRKALVAEPIGGAVAEEEPVEAAEDEAPSVAKKPRVRTYGLSEPEPYIPAGRRLAADEAAPRESSAEAEESAEDAPALKPAARRRRAAGLSGGSEATVPEPTFEESEAHEAEEAAPADLDLAAWEEAEDIDHREVAKSEDEDTSLEDGVAFEAAEEEDALDPAPESAWEEEAKDPLVLVESLPFAAADGEDAIPKKPPVKSERGADSEALSLIRLDRSEGVKKRDRYPLPPLELLAEPIYLKQRESEELLQQKATTLEVALADFNVDAQVTEIERGPVITRFDLELSRGTRISKVTALQDDLALTLGVGAVRIAAVPGKSALGVEMPNQMRETVFLRDVAVATESKLSKIAIPIFLGKDASGAPLVEDLASTPHLLIAGRTGAGKSVFVNSLILSVLLTRRPEDVRLIMIDPKKVELEVYQEIPHLLTPVESNPKRATKILEWAVDQMEERYALLAAAGVRHLVSYNGMKKAVREEKLLAVYPEEVVDNLPDQMPYVVIIVDELADLMMAAGKEVENAIARLAQKARAVGIHVVLATQRPSTDVITGLIKSNLPARIAFQTRTGIDSRTILDRMGAEKLLDKGDMLYLSSKSDEPRRIQGPFVSDDEVEAIVAYLRQNASPYYQQKLEQVASSDGNWADSASQDEFFEQAVDIVMTTGQASASFLQRRLKVGYARASRLIDLMEAAGIVSEHRGSKVREIIISPEQWAVLRGEAQ